MLNLKTIFCPFAELFAMAKEAAPLVVAENPDPAFTVVPPNEVICGFEANEVQALEPNEPSM
ncbi:MAG: hypothetical protein NTZ16_14360 [Verrucomicrobia bacterium]|nr:hypothetical protein [Verrucomicrobiota bacterium]